MTSWKRMLAIFGAFALMILMGQGCVPEDLTNTSQNNTGGTTRSSREADDDYTTAACPTGTVRFISSRENVTFCHPDKVGDSTVTVDDAANSVTIRVDNDVARVIALETVAKDVDRKEKVMDYAADPSDDSITCEAQSVENRQGREAYILVGMKDGTQEVGATDVCVDSTSLNNALNDQPVGKFFFYDDEEELIVVSSSQDPVFGQLTDDFEATIWPKN